MGNEYTEFFEEFMEESKDHLNTMNLSLLELEKEKSSPSQEHIDNLFRAAHTVKGLSGMMEFETVEALCHAIEDLMDLVRNRVFFLNDEAFQILFKSLDLLETLFNELSEDKTTETPVDEVIQDIKTLIEGGSPSAEQENDQPSESPGRKHDIAVDFDYVFDEFTISEIEKIKIEQAVKDDRFIYELMVPFEGGTPLEELETLPIIDTCAEAGTILLFSPPLREIEAANKTIKTIILVASPLSEKEFASHVSEPFELIRKGKEVKPAAKAVEPPPPPVKEEIAPEPEPEPETAHADSFVETDYSNIPFCEDLSMVDNDILEGYNADVGELIEGLDLALIDLENSPEDMNTINSVFRAAHTIKGTSAMFGFSRVVELTHKLENLFDDVRKEKIKVDSDIMDIVFSAVDKLRICLDEIKALEDMGADITVEANSIARFMESQKDGAPKPVASAKPKQEQQTHAPSEYTVAGFQLSETNKRLIDDGLSKGKRLYSLGISFNEDVMKTSFDPMNIFMILEMTGDLIASVLDISHVPDFEHFDSEKFYLRYNYLIVSDQAETEIRNTIMAMEQVIINSLADVTPGNEVKSEKATVAPQTETPKTQEIQTPKPVTPKKEEIPKDAPPPPPGGEES